MQKILSLALAIAFLTTFAPTVDAGEGASREYVAGGVNAAGRGTGFITCYEPDQGIDDLFPECEVLRTAGYDGGVGGTDLIVSGFYAGAIVSASDEVYGGAPAMSTCFYHPDGDTICEDGPGTLDGVEDYPGDIGCGVRAIVGAPFLSNLVSMFTYTVFVAEDLTLCGASAGVATADFF